MRRPALALLAAGALAAGVAYGPGASAAPAPVDPLAYGFQGEGGELAQDRDSRAGSVSPTESQRSAVRALGARTTWNALGSPDMLVRDDTGYLSGPQTGAPADVARAWVRSHAGMFGLSASDVTPQALELLNAVPLAESPELRAQLSGTPLPARKRATVVMFRQVFEGAPTGEDGLLTVGMDPDGRVAVVSSTVTGNTDVTNKVELNLIEAYLKAAKDAGVEIGNQDVAVTELRMPGGAQVLRVRGVEEAQPVRLVTVPTPRDGVRLAYETVVLRGTPGDRPDQHPYAYRSLVDAQTGTVLVRSNALQHAADDGVAAPPSSSVPFWRVFKNAPQFPKAGTKTPDTRVYWCFMAGASCDRVLGVKGGKPNTAGAYAYDENLTDSGSRVPTFSTRGNNAQTAPSRVSFLTPDAAVSPVSPTRTYDFPFTDQWHSSGCNPASFTSPGLNDIDAATTNLFVMHNRMHDWSYYLGFTPKTYNAQVDNAGSENDKESAENDPEIGNSQSGSIGGGPTFQGRDNANQITLGDGTPPITNQYLWEPLQAGFYAPCTDGAYDMGIVAHEYGHMISNRMTAGPVSGLSGMQATSMGEAWSDLMATEYLNGYGLAPYNGENRFSLAPYVTGDLQTGIRNYGPNKSPLNYSDLEYDANGVTSPHADGEIWNATQIDIRQALVAKYAAQFPEGDKALQNACADGLKPSTSCPGNRRWMQLLFDGFLTQPSQTTMLTSRDAILAADKMRYRGANLPTLWASFAKRGMGANAASASVADLASEPGFKNPLSKSNGSVRFKPVAVAGGGVPALTKVFVGDYEARIVPVGESAKGAPTAVVQFEPGTYRLYVQAKGYGHRRLTVTIKPGAQTISLPMRKNLASSAAGGQAFGDGGNLARINDDTEATNWGSIDGAVRNPGEAVTIRGKQVTVDLAGGAHLVREIQVSAANRPVCAGKATENGCESNDADDPPYDTGGQSRFAALRSFEILTCDATAGKACKDAGDFTSRLVKRDAFPAGRPRPTAPDLNLRSFPLPAAVKATHVRIKVLDNQCTGGAAYAGKNNVEGNPLNDPDCTNGFATAAAAGAPTTLVSLSQKKNVRISELQVFGSAAAASTSAGAPGAGPAGGQLPTTGPLPIALPALLLLVIGGLVHRVRRTG